MKFTHPFVHQSTHPILLNNLTVMRSNNCQIHQFNRLIRICGILLGYEAARNLRLDSVRIQTPIAILDNAPILAAPTPAIIPILRAGLALADGVRDIIESAVVVHIGISKKSSSSGDVVIYYSNIPAYNKQPFFLIDPVIATGATLSMAINALKDNGVPEHDIIVISLVGSLPGISAFVDMHPNTHLYIIDCDTDLDQNRFVSPGIGDMGDRLFGTA